MRKYLTWRCIGLHALVLVLVPAFLVAGWWQYHVALGGNDLSWVYTVEWPFFAVYAVYIWWKLIHDERTPFDRLWGAKQRAAADAEGKPLHEVPGWATDKALSSEVHRAARDAARHPELAFPRRSALDERAREPSELLPVLSDPSAPSDSTFNRSASDHEVDADADADAEEHLGPLIDAQVLEVKVHVDEDLEAYNRYLFELSRNGPPKRWGARRRGGDGDPPELHETTNPVPERPRPALPPTNEEN